jgi:hypothetical protein
MAMDAVAIDTDQTAPVRRKRRRTPRLFDGRTRWARRRLTLVKAFTEDACAAGRQLSVRDAATIANAAALVCRAEQIQHAILAGRAEAGHTDELVRVTNVCQRLLRSVGIRAAAVSGRRPVRLPRSMPSLDEVLARVRG